ncbi:MAG: HNH endonuclease [Zetaproteobacteria bacterium CG1_02_53_45]|nr:MAG: HNH endonuclease [Zetaproteobacteria bacterium CG1_02_53_45]
MSGSNESYREQALKLYPWVCGRCGRDFTGKQLKELTVHHKDHNHSNNPPDGSNWELLCIYCHDNEHQRYMEADAHGDIKREESNGSSFKGLAGLADLLKEKE